MSTDHQPAPTASSQEHGSGLPRQAEQSGSITLLPPELIPLDADHERLALDVLADILADYLNRQRGVQED